MQIPEIILSIEEPSVENANRLRNDIVSFINVIQPTPIDLVFAITATLVDAICGMSSNQKTLEKNIRILRGCFKEGLKQAINQSEHLQTK